MSGLPKKIHLPFARPIRVIELPGTDERITGCDGLWDDEERVIYIHNRLSHKKKKYVLYHELLHAVHDLAYQLDHPDDD